MAELGLAIFAIPENTFAIVKLTQLLLQRLESCRVAATSVNELKTFGYELQSGQLWLGIQVVKDLVAKKNGHGEEALARLRWLAGTHLEKLRRGLEKVVELLDRSLKKDRSVKKYLFAFWVEPKLRKRLEELRGWQVDFTGFVVLAEKYSGGLKSEQKSLLTVRRLRLVSNREGMETCGDTKTGMFIAKAEYRNEEGTREDVKVLIEPLNMGDCETEDAREIAALMASNLEQCFSGGGILQCLGYRVNPRLELVFQMPHQLSKPVSLRQLIQRDSNDLLPIKPTISSRLLLAVEVAKATLSVHAAKMVHKNIRPDTILVFQADTQHGSHGYAGGSLGTPILTAWSMARKIDELSSRLGENDWTRNIYRHPERQGLHLEQRYHLGHDLYSLGVCLLELGLWESMIMEQDGAPALCSRYCNIAVRMELVRPEEANVPKRTTKTAVTKEVFKVMCKDDLSELMGLEYSRVVMACFETPQAQEKIDMVLMYRERILQPLARLIA